MYIAGFAPIEARVRDQDFNSRDEQGEKTQRGDPMSDTDQGRVPRSNRSVWDSRGRNCGPCGIAHRRMLASGERIAQGGGGCPSTNSGKDRNREPGSTALTSA